MKRIPEAQDLPRPYLVFNQHYAMVHPLWKSWLTRLSEIWRELIGIDKFMSAPNLPEKVSEAGIKTGKFYEDAIVIDRDCKRYNVTGYELLGRYRDFWNLGGLSRKKEYYYRLLVSEPTELDFETARSQIIDHCVSRRWANQTGATPKQFKEHHQKKDDITEVMEDIGFLGRYPFH